MSFNYRIDEETLARVRSVFKQYEATHKFHNYTPSASHQDKHISRYIMSTKITDPILVSTDEVLTYGTKLRSISSSRNKNNSGSNASSTSSETTQETSSPTKRAIPEDVSHIEMVTFVVEGQSFMYNQIRKMVGMAIAVIRGQSEPYSIPNSFLANRVHAPKAPGLGLALDRVRFESYIAKVQKDNARQTASNLAPECLVHFEHCEQALENFKRENIWAEILYKEVTEGVMWKWLHYLSTLRAGVDTRPDEELKRCEEKLVATFGEDALPSYHVTMPMSTTTSTSDTQPSESERKKKLAEFLGDSDDESAGKNKEMD